MTSPSAAVRRFEEIDWDFPSQSSTSLFSDLHWHPCRFPSQVPAIAIARFSNPGDSILDPFMGSGTTLVEAQRLGRHSHGIDVNPIACLQAKSKLLLASSEEVAAITRKHTMRLLQDWERLSEADIPKNVQVQKWYTSKTGRDLAKLWGYVDRSRGPFRAILEGAFSSILMPCCREVRHWGYICDNTEPKSNRERDALALYLAALVRYSKAYKARDEQLRSNAVGEAEVIQGDAREVLKNFDKKFSCFVTSPPYLGVADYVKSQRLSMEWFSQEIEPFRKVEIGARSKRHRKTAADEYLDDLEDVFRSTFMSLKIGAWGVIVFGQSPSRKTVEDEFVDRLRHVGFQIFSQGVRQISDMRRQFPSLKHETVLLVRRPVR